MFYRHFRNELWKLFGKKRTYIGFGAFLLVQTAMLLMFRFGRVRAEMERTLAGNGYLASEYISTLTVAVIMLIPQVALLMPLYAALVGGDMVAKEVEEGTLRMILSRPISRFRLLFMKWLAGVLFATLLVLVLGGTALCLARIWFPWQGMFVSWPGIGFNVLSAGTGFKLYLWSHLVHGGERECRGGSGFHVLLLQHEACRRHHPGVVRAVHQHGDGEHSVL